MSALHEAGGKFSRIDVYKNRTDQNEDEYRIEVSDMQSGAAVAATVLPLSLDAERREFKNFSDGNLYLQLKEATVLRFDPGAAVCGPRPLLMAQFPSELGVGLAGVRFSYDDRPDCLQVVTNDGRKYHVYWVAGQILDAEVASQLDEQRAAKARQTRKYYRYAPLDKGSSLEKRFLLVQYWNKYENGQPQYLTHFELKPLEEAGSFDRDVGGGYAVSHYSVTRGLVRLEVIDATPRFKAEVLAENATSVAVL